MTTHNGVPVAIVGAGPTGVMLAIELARRGVRVRIFDKQPKRSTETRAIGIHARTLETFHQLGIVDQFLERGHKTTGMAVHTRARRSTHVDFGALDSPYPFVLMLGQDQTQEMLDRKLEQLGVSIERGAELTKLDHQEDGIEITISRSREQEEAFCADWVVGCDGARSIVRRHLGVPFDGDDYGQDWLMAEVNIDWPIDRQRFHVFSYTATPVVAFPLPANRWRVFLPQVPNRAGERQPPDMQEIERLIAQRGPAAMKLTNPTLLQAFRCYRRSTRIMRHGRLLVAGDAAHIHSPAGGQGMNTGLHDACNLGWKLAGVAQRQASPELLNTYQDERLPIAAGVLEFTHTLVRLFTISSPRKRWLRDRVLPIAMSVPAAERNYTRSLSQVSHSYRGGPLAPSSSRPKRGSIAAGDRLPSVFGLERDGKPLSTLDLLGSTAHTLLVFSGQRADQEAAAAAIAHLAPFNGTVRIVSVDQRPGTHKPHSVTDPQLRAHRRYGALRGQLFLVRPDGYLACRAPLNRPDIPERYLDRLTSQLARTQSTTKSSSSRANGGRVASLAVEGTELFYEERGSGPTILLIHCTGGNGDVWAPVLGGLAGGHRVIVYDRRGHSRSAQPPVKDLDVHVRDAAALVRALDAAPATAVGWSWGGLIALGLAIQAPELVSGLVLEEPPLHAKKHPAWDQIRAIGSAQLLRMAGRQRQGARVFLRWAFSYRTGGTAFDRMPDDLQKAMLANARAVMWELDAGTGEELTAERIAAIKCPVTCLVGDLTPKPILNATDRLLDMLPQASRTTIEGAAHAIHFDRPAEFVQAVQHAAA